MATTTLNERLATENARLKAEIERLKVEAETSRQTRRRHRNGKLTVAQIKSLMPGKLYFDGNNVLIKPAGPGYGCFIYRYKISGKKHDIGLGGYTPKNVSETLAAAHRRATEYNLQRDNGVDPATERRQQKLAQRLVRAKAMTFAQCAEALFRKEETGWSSPKHARQWLQIFKDYIDPILGAQPIAVIDTALVLKVLEPIWQTKTESATRARQIIEAVIDWAAASEYRAKGDNPARWRGHLQRLLPKKSMVKATKHHAALPYAELPGFMVRLRQDTSIAARCLEVTILCCLRTNESRWAQWPEIDLKKKLWVVPAERMKGKKGQRKAHRVPLSEPVIAILEELERHKTGSFVFAAPDAVKPVGANAMLQVLARLGVECTTHGFRSCFADWSAEMTHFSSEVREMVLAHKIPNVVEAAYRRGDLFEKRGLLMQTWATYATGPASEGAVVSFPGTHRAA